MKISFMVMVLLGVVVVDSWAAAPTPTFTPTQIAILDPNFKRVDIPFSDIFQADRVNRPLSTPLPGSDQIWFQAVQNQSCFVLSTGAAQCSFRFRVPADYAGPSASPRLRLWALANNSGISSSVVVSTTVHRTRFNTLTSTAQTFSSPTINIQTQTQGTLLNSTFSFVKLPVPVGITQVAKNDLINFTIARLVGSTELRIGQLVVEYQPQPGLNP